MGLDLWPFVPKDTFVVDNINKEIIKDDIDDDILVKIKGRI